MFRKVEDFKNAWKYEAEMTGKVLGTLTDASLGQRVTSEGRTLGFLGWHLTVTLGEMLGHVGLKIDAPEQDAECPTSAAAIAAVLIIRQESVPPDQLVKVYRTHGCTCAWCCSSASRRGGGPRDP